MLEKCSSNRQVTKNEGLVWLDQLPTEQGQPPGTRVQQLLYLYGTIIIKDLGKYMKSLNFHKNSLSKEHAEKVQCSKKDIE